MQTIICAKRTHLSPACLVIIQTIASLEKLVCKTFKKSPLAFLVVLLDLAIPINMCVFIKEKL